MAQSIQNYMDSLGPGETASRTRDARYIPVPRKVKCIGGPWSGETIRLQGHETLVFTVQGMTGYYEGKHDLVQWHDV